MLDHASQRVREHLGSVEAHPGVLGLLTELRHQYLESEDRMVVRERQGGVYHVLPTREIDWIRAKDGGVIVHFEKRLYRSGHTLAEVETFLAPRGFLRIHRSTIVNRARIRSVEPLWKGEYKLTLTTGTSLVSGRTYQAAIERFLSWA